MDIVNRADAGRVRQKETERMIKNRDRKKIRGKETIWIDKELKQKN